MSIRYAGCLPSRAHLDPVQMAEWLAHTELLDVIDQGKTFRYRVAGGAVEQIFHCSMHGRLLDDIFSGDVLSFKQFMFRRCLNNRTMILSNDSLERGSKSLLKYERVLIPLSSDSFSVDTLFGCIYPMKKSVERISMSDPELAIISEEVVEEALAVTD